MDILMPMLAGLTLGCIHAFDADHLVAVSALSTKEPSPGRAGWLGVLWGLGHLTTILVLGLVSLFFKFVIPPVVESAAELAVGFLAVLIGVWVLIDLLRQKHVHLHKHTHDGIEHVHFHSHARSRSHHHRHSMFLVGATHGFAGTASVLVIIPIAITQSLLSATLYLLLFGVGTIVSMAGFAFLLGTVSRLARVQRVFPYWKGIAGLVSIGVGFFWIGARIL